MVDNEWRTCCKCATKDHNSALPNTATVTAKDNPKPSSSNEMVIGITLPGTTNENGAILPSASNENGTTLPATANGTENGSPKPSTAGDSEHPTVVLWAWLGPVLGLVGTIAGSLIGVYCIRGRSSKPEEEQSRSPSSSHDDSQVSDQHQ